nr:hypothetical protein BaRGS_007116 [Batillaria attramentaria]
MVCLTGPPGTGKTLLLVLKGLRWLRQGHDVHVVCVFLRSLVACLLIYHQLRRTLLQDSTTPATAGTVHFHQFDLSKGEDSLRAALNTLTSSARDGHLYVIMDEANPFAWDVNGSRRRLIEELSAIVPQLSLWTASVYIVGIPTCLKEEPLTIPLRCAPAVHRELDALIRMQTKLIHLYSRSSAPLPSDGPKVIRQKIQTFLNTCLRRIFNIRWPEKIRNEELWERAGQEPVAKQILRRKWGWIGHTLRKPASSTTRQALTWNPQGKRKRGRPRNSWRRDTEAELCPRGKRHPPPLQYRDVFVLAHNSDVLSDYIKDTENTSSQGSDFVQALRSAGIPVCVFGKKEEDIDSFVKRSGDVAVARDDVTMVTHYDAVTGLERKLVVYLQGRVQGSLAEFIDRVCAMARCTTQLVMVELPQLRESLAHDFDLD